MIHLTPEKCRAMRAVRGLGKAELSRKAGLATNYVGRFEDGQFPNASARVLRQIADALDGTPVVPGVDVEVSAASDEREGASQ